MQVYKAPLRDMRFNLDALGYSERIASLEAFQNYDQDTVLALLDQGGAFAERELLPLNRLGDSEGVKWDPETGAVTTPKGFREVYQKLVENGFVGLTSEEEFGGSGAPETVSIGMSEMAMSCNKSLMMCPGLTLGLVHALEKHGSEQQMRDYLPKLVSGEWAGTMCLTEPQCGTDLGLVRTKAMPEGDHYLLTGTKIWITFGEQDLTENIIHLVLARLPDAPEGIKGISCFLVPKFKMDGTPNNVRCTGIEHKMGINASPTCVIDMEASEGYLVGQPHKGMRTMFVMMNQARLHVGLEGISAGEIAYQTAVAFAKDRRQSRSLNPSRQDSSASADTILVHPDVRRMLLDQKSTNEALRTLAFYIALHLDLSRKHPEESVRQEADDIVALLTPVMKSYGTERGFYNTSLAMQVCGGSGYTKDWSIEQYMRDVRIAMIYEGTNGIQALDLVGRKLPKAGGRLLQSFQSQITNFLRETKEVAGMEEFTTALKATSKELTAVTMELATKGMSDPEEVAAVAANYLKLFGLTTLTFMWNIQVRQALRDSDAYSETKVRTARYFISQILPERHGLVEIIRSGGAHMMAFDEEELG
ncbi:MAG: acyl-CoA dehydrogenase [Myxococcales bacterium]|nr:acyl-CoA dehydrogenase [Myxococcales bacterium]